MPIPHATATLEVNCWAADAHRRASGSGMCGGAPAPSSLHPVAAGGIRHSAGHHVLPTLPQHSEMNLMIIFFIWCIRLLWASAIGILLLHPLHLVKIFSRGRGPVRHPAL